ncbi:MAG: HEAT repeat domain-containing protein [Acidobacteria bacterium]|nr:HEAT repeat domain-containing protein [Acidobacteriota bacterium]
MLGKYFLWIVLALCLIAFGFYLITGTPLFHRPESIHNAANDNSGRILGDEGSTYNYPSSTKASVQGKSRTGENLSLFTGSAGSATDYSSRKGTSSPEQARALVLLEKWRRSQNFSGMDPVEEFNTQELIDALHHGSAGMGEFYSKVLEIMKDSSVPLSAKQELLFILSRTATPEAVRVMAELVPMDLPVELKPELYTSISMVGEYFWDRGDLFRASVPVLELWSQSQDPEVLNALAAAMGNIGNSVTLDYLFQSVLREDSTLADIRNSNDPRVTAALLGLEKVRTPEAAPFIAARLQDSRNNMEMAICAGILASMDNAAGTQYLLSWIPNADDSFAAYVPDIFQRISPAGLVYLETVNLRSLDFRSYPIEQAVLAALGLR